MANLRNRMPVVFSAAFAVAVSAWLTGAAHAAQGNAEAAKIKNPVAADPDSIAAGKALYAKNCAPCHGVNGTGGSGNDLIGPAPDLTDAEWQHGGTDGEIFTNIKDGITGSQHGSVGRSAEGHRYLECRELPEVDCEEVGR